MSVSQTGLRNRATLNAMESPEPNRFTKAPSEYRVQYEHSSFAWMFSQAVGGHPVSQTVCTDAKGFLADATFMAAEYLLRSSLES